jgi:hypothetical protein
VPPGSMVSVETKGFSGFQVSELDAEDQARAGQAGFGFLQFGDVQRSHLKAAGFQPGSGFRKGSREDYRTGQGERVGGVRLCRIDIDEVVGIERSGIEPQAIGEHGVAAEIGDGGFEMQAASHGNRDDFVFVRSDDLRELSVPFGVAASRQAGEKFAVDAQNVAAFDGAGQLDICELAEWSERLRERRGFRTPRSAAERKNDRQLVENDRGIFDEHGIGQRRLRRQRNHAGSETFERSLVIAVLVPGFLQIDSLALDEAEFAIGKTRADDASNGGEHECCKVYTRKS